MIEYFLEWYIYICCLVIFKSYKSVRVIIFLYFFYVFVYCSDWDGMLFNLKDKKFLLCYLNMLYMCINCLYFYEFFFYGRMFDNWILELGWFKGEYDIF